MSISIVLWEKNWFVFHWPWFCLQP
jgi:hypothetical protein